MGLTTSGVSAPLDPNTTAGRDFGAGDAQIDAQLAKQHASFLKALEDTKADFQPRLEALGKRLREAVDEVEKLDEPRRRKAELDAEFSGLRSTFLTLRSDLERKVQQHAPRKLQHLIQNLQQRPQTPALDKAIRELSKLSFVSGDVKPAMQAIMATLAKEAAAEDLSRVKHLLS